MSSRERKRKTTTPESNPVPSFPDELMLNCLARVSRLYYPSLSLVSKSFRSLIALPELYETRSLLRRTESCLYVYLEFPEPDRYPGWFTLCRKPDRTQTNHTGKKKKKSIGNLLVPIPSPRSSRLFSCWHCLVSVSSNIYKIGGPIKQKPSSSVSVLDCRSHTWREAPSLLVKRLIPSASVLDGKIYVGGGCGDNGDLDSLKSVEVFDTKTQTWDQVPSPNPNRNVSWSCCTPRSVCIEGKFHLILGRECLGYDPKEGRWDLVEPEIAPNATWSYCAIENVFYWYYKGEFQWYDTKVRLWKKLKGLVGLPKFARYAVVRLADYGGKLAVLWDKNSYLSGYKKKMLWCAEIALEKRDGDEIWGKVEWLDGVLPVPDSYYLEMKVLAATL